MDQLISVLGDEALLVTELRPKSGFYDFDAKYTDGMTDHICPADIPDDVTEQCKAIALRAHQLQPVLWGLSLLTCTAAPLLSALPTGRKVAFVALALVAGLAVTAVSVVLYFAIYGLPIG